jgi:bifunctional enzyme CysN/CysC
MTTLDDPMIDGHSAVTGSLLRIATAGSVDDGKSTLIGRLLYDSKQIFEDTIEAISEASEGRGTEFDLSLITDGLRAEREQGITIDVAYRHFATPRRAFILADTPGHIRYTRNMVTGASTADLALVLVDARNGFVQQSRRHLFIASLLRIPHVIVCINKMDLVDYDERVYDSICAEIRSFASRLEIGDLSFIPISALVGDNVVEPSEHMLWYGGPPLLYQLEHVQVTSDRNLIDVRLPVQWVIRPGAGEPEYQDYRGYAGKMASGVLRVGDEVRILPSGESSHVKAISNHTQQLEEAYPPLSVAVELTDDIDISRGDLICRPRNHPAVSRDVDAIVCWMAEEPSRAHGRYLVKHTANTTRGVISEVIHRIDVDTLHHDDSAELLALNEIGRIRLRTGTPLVFDAYDRNRRTGSFILIDEATNATVAAGMILGVADTPAATGEGANQQSSNVVWQPSRMTREQRWNALGRVGATLWVTGLPAAGKSTIGDALEERLITSGIAAMRLDGDNLRHGLNGNLGFDPADRAENIRRAAHAAKLLAEAGTIAIVTVVSPYAAGRHVAREIHENDGVTFIEVFVDTPLDECERRDPKGLYAKARAGEIVGMTGVDDAYEIPQNAELILRPSDAPTAVEALLKELRHRGIVA